MTQKKFIKEVKIEINMRVNSMVETYTGQSKVLKIRSYCMFRPRCIDRN